MEDGDCDDGFGVVRFRSEWSVVNRNGLSQEKVVACESSCDVPSCERMRSDADM